MSDIHFYCGYVRTDINEPFVFEVEELEIEKVLEDGTIKLKYPYFYCSSDSTYYFSGRSGEKTDRELKLSHGLVFYSTDKNKCKDFVIDKMQEMNGLADKIRKRMQDSKFEIKLLGDNL